VLELSGLVDHFLELLEAGLRQNARQLAGAVAPPHAQFLPHESGDSAEPFVVEPGAANGVGDGGDEFRISVPASEVWAFLGAGHAQSPRDCWSRFEFWPLCETGKPAKVRTAVMARWASITHLEKRVA
jgi:hypothetical protein